MKRLFSVGKMSPFEVGLWALSVLVNIAAFALTGGEDLLTLVSSTIGVTALIFVAKGAVIGQVLTVVFAVFYGIVSFYFRYYGEMITYLAMTAPMAILAAVQWFKNPYGSTGTVKVKRLGWGHFVFLLLSSAAVTLGLGLLLKRLGNANLLFSIISVTTSWLASCLTFFRSPLYALAYAANDIVLIVLWVLAALHEPSYLPMVTCFIMFFLNDLYGFFNWRKMAKIQGKSKAKKALEG